jgi:integrative and conjugative element protein (TIGR02256 family)
MADSNVSHPIVYLAEDVRETITLEAGVVARVCGYRQVSPWAKEAGGQLFGTVSGDRVIVRTATGPYCRDERARYNYRSHPPSAQRAIRREAKRGLVYLGEWHTHAEDMPHPSGADESAMRALRAQSEIRVRSLVLLIVGRTSPPDNLCLFSTHGGPLQRWTVDSASPVISCVLDGGAYECALAVLKARRIARE